MSTGSVMPSNHLILCCPLLLPPAIFPSTRVFSIESVLHIRWSKYWNFSFSISPSNEYSGLFSLRIDWLDLLAVQGTLKSLLQYHSSKASILRCSAFFIVQLSHSYMTTGKTIALTRQTFVGKVMSLLFNTLSRLTILWRPIRPFRTNTQKWCPFHYRGLECKSRKSRNTWSNRQIWPWSTEWSTAKANRVLPRERTGHSKHPLPTTQEKTLHRDTTRWSTLKSDWLHSLQPKMEKLIQSAKARLEADCGSDHELLIAKFRLKLKKVEKTTRPFRYDLNQIPYDYIVEVRNRFKGLDLIECLKNYGWRFVTLYRRQ